MESPRSMKSHPSQIFLTSSCGKLRPKEGVPLDLTMHLCALRKWRMVGREQEFWISGRCRQAILPIPAPSIRNSVNSWSEVWEMLGRVVLAYYWNAWCSFKSKVGVGKTGTKEQSRLDRDAQYSFSSSSMLWRLSSQSWHPSRLASTLQQKGSSI